MSQPQNPQSEDKTNPKANNRWTNISSDQDESESEQSEKQQPQQVTPTPSENKEPAAELPKEETKKKEPNIVPFDAKKKFRGDRSNVKVIKGGFKAEKLQQKKFQLNTIRNPFAVDDDSEEQKQDAAEPATQNGSAPQAETRVEEAKEAEEKPKKAKKSKKQQEKQQLEELMKELGVQNKAEEAQEGQAKKKKKKNKAKKPEAQEESKQQPQPVQAQPQKVEQFVVDRQQIEQVMRKKATEATKPAGKKGGKASVALNARKAIQERQAKNKSKKVYVDL